VNFPLNEGEGEGEYAFCGIIRDITERKEAERAVKKAYDDLELRVYQRTMELNESNRVLRREIRERQRVDERLGISEAKNQALLEGIPDLMILYRMDGTIVDLKPTKGTSNELTPEECVNRKVEEVFPPEMSKTIRHYIRKAQQTREMQTAEYQVVTQGKREYYEVRYVTAGESEVLSIVRNVTSGKELEKKIYQHAEKLEHLVEERTEQIRTLGQRRMQSEKLAALGQLAAGVAHEINNPLASLSNAFLLIKDTMSTDTEVSQYISAADREIVRINKIVQQMYQLYGVDSQEAGPADFHKILQEVFGLLGKQIKSKNVTLVLDIPDEVPQVVVPETQVIQVLCNIVQNAIDASPEGATIKVTVKPQETELRVEVVDSGSGISPELRAQIFEPFFTTKTGRQKSRMGLGLSVSNSLIEAMGGKIEVHSSFRKGTTFALVFPLKSSGITNDSIRAKEVEEDV
jgi:PAS domain S-box-containing protein